MLPVPVSYRSNTDKDTYNTEHNFGDGRTKAKKYQRDHCIVPNPNFHDFWFFFKGFHGVKAAILEKRKEGLNKQKNQSSCCP